MSFYGAVDTHSWLKTAIFIAIKAKSFPFGVRSPVTSTKPNVNFYLLNPNTNISYISFIFYGTTRTEHADLQTGLFFICSTVFSRPAVHLPEMSAVSMELVCIKCAVRFYLVTER